MSTNNELKKMMQIVFKEAMKPVLEELQSLNHRVASLEPNQQSLESGQKELNQLIRAIYDRQEETDAKLEALSMDVHKLHGELSTIKQGQERQDKILARV